MEIAITGKQIDIGSSLRSYVEEHIEAAVKKFFENPLSASISFSKVGGGLIRSDISVHPISGVSIQGSAETGDAYASFDGACERISKQMQRYKKRLTNHKFDTEPVSVAVIEPETTEDSLPSEEAAPVVIAEMQTELPLCTVSGAVMRMDLADVPALMFRNIAHGGLNMVYRRSDGNIGWIDPQQ